MKKLFYFLFLLPFLAIGQVSTGQEQDFDYGLRNLAPQTVTTPDNFCTQGADGTIGIIPQQYVEQTAFKQPTPFYDGTGQKYPSLDLMNDNFLENTKLFARTGITSKTDQLDLTVLDINTLRILPVDRAFFYNEIFGAGKIANDGFRTFPQKDYPLTQLVTATGGNINVNPIVSDGKTARFIGYDKDGNVISSISNFAENPDVVQLGFVTVVKSGASVQFLDITPGGRNCAANPILANLNDLDRTDIGLSSTVTINYNTGAPTLNSSNGIIKKAGANWRGVTNPSNTNPIDYLSYVGQATVSFTPIDPTFATSAAAITPISNWTTLVGGIAFNESFWNKTTVAKGTMNNNTFSVKRVIQGVRGGIFIQDGEHTSTACFANLAEAQSNLYNASLFTDAIVPPEVGTEIARIVYQKSVTVFSDNSKFIIYPTARGGVGGSGSITPVADATTVSKGIIQLAGDLSGTADAPTVPALSNKVNGAGALTTNAIPKASNSTTLTNSNISDNGTTITLATDAVINGHSIGRGGGGINTNVRFGVNALANNTSGSDNTAIGYWSLLALSNVSSLNTAIGRLSLTNISSGNNNTALGADSGRYIADGVTTLTNSSNSVYIGYSTRANANGVTNENVFGYNAIGNGSNSVTLGNTSVTKTILRGRTLINTETDNGTDNLQVNGSATATQWKSSVSTGISPLQVASTTNVTNLNADLLDGQHGSYYAPIASPAFTGTPTAPTPTAGDNSTKVATTAYVDGAVTTAGNTYVKLTGNQDIGGQKRWFNDTTNNGRIVVVSGSTAPTYGINISNSSASYAGLNISDNASSTTSLRIASQFANNTAAHLLDNNGSSNNNILLKLENQNFGNNAKPISVIKNSVEVAKVDYDGKITSSQFRISALNTAPSSATDTGTTGEIRIVSDYIYVCIATNTWVRTPLTTW